MRIRHQPLPAARTTAVTTIAATLLTGRTASGAAGSRIGL
jgi:hypothetical protein